MKFLEKDLICIDLDGIENIDQFKTLIKKVKKSNIIIEESLWSLKSDLKISKIFLHKTTLEIIFIEVNINGDFHIGLYPFISDKLMKMKPLTIKKNMNMDSILERISKNGIQSLTKKEEKILKKIKK
jgi:hypothetical protein